MAKHLTKTDIEAILNIIAAHEGDSKLTWEGICDKCASIVGKNPTRQSLFANQTIREVSQWRFHRQTLTIQDFENIWRSANHQVHKGEPGQSFQDLLNEIKD